MEIGKKIKRLRLQRGLTQEELADRCELSKGFISLLERDLTSPSIATLMDILESLGSDLRTPILLELGPGGETAEDDPHEGEEFGYVLSGSLKIILGDRIERVKRDESFYFRPTAPHRLVNAGKTPCRVLWVSTPPSF